MPRYDDTDLSVIWMDDPDDPEGDLIEIKLPTKKEVCGTCRGKGTHVNPAIDGNGISMEEWWGPDWDDESREMYLTGGYDVRCYECHGNNVVDVVDEDMLSPELKEAYYKHLDDHYAMIAEMRAEQRMGC